MPELIINGPAGRLEARYHHEAASNSPIALILHPHPQFGGTMNNQVVYALYYMFVERGFSVLRFNFRGVGRSQGYFDNGAGRAVGCGLRARLAAAAEPRCAIVLDRRRVVRHLDRHAAADAAARRSTASSAWRRRPTSTTSRSWRPARPRADRERRQGPRRAVGVGGGAGRSRPRCRRAQDRARHRARTPTTSSRTRSKT